ncbi:MAG: group II intron reverse transcriptase/maturase [Pirellula sp.]|nr:group II intron reverse transcriptase/maturase [Pirellula sp.]
MSRKRPKKHKQPYTAVTVPFSATPPREPVTIRQWAQSLVWTENMLTTLLENRVRGGKWHTLYDKVMDRANLSISAVKVVEKQGAAGVDRQTVEKFWENHRENLEQLQRELKDESYRPAPVRSVEIPKPGSRTETRRLGIPTVRDRVVQKALVHVLEPILDHSFHPRSFGFRHGMRCEDALRCVEQLMGEGYVYVVDADLKSYFDTIPKDRLLALVQQKISDSAVLRLVKKYLDQSVMSTLSTWTPINGVPQGAVLSPLLANLYLNPLDHLMSEKGYQMVRYADDFVILCKSESEARAALEEVRSWVEQAGLTLHPDKTHIVDCREKSFSFLGYSFRGRLRFPRSKSHKKLVDRIRALTPRSSGVSLKVTIDRLNRMLPGWFRYFRHCFWHLFGDYDGFIRERLRRILTKRHRRNPQRLPSHKRWKDAYFSELGLFSLREAHTRFVQSIGTY